MTAALLPMICPAQTIVDGNRLRGMAAWFDAKSGESRLRCEITPLHPTLNYGFRFQAGYRIVLAANQFQGDGHGWTVLTRITPRVEGARPVYLRSFMRLPHVPQTNARLAFGGSYLLGEGTYDVAWLLRDDQSRVCRKNWRIEVHRGRSEHDVKVAMPANTVWDISLRNARLVQPTLDDARALRLTILLNAAPLFQQRMRLRGGDIGTLLSAVDSLLERVPTSNVRLVVFNLEQQRELYRNADFHLSNMLDVVDAMNAIELATVDYTVLQNRKGHVDLVADLVNQETNASDPSDVVLVIGPMSRFFDRVPAELLHARSGSAPRFLNLRIIPLTPEPATFPDVIHNAIAHVGGKTVAVHSPGEFAKAIARLEEGK
ncbi:MAG TPA: hypothetical protein VKE70_08025 [Candidatus Solibacter sp.]|nr:hypothetical protein [Candidatus Solibacter sp.]